MAYWLIPHRWKNTANVDSDPTANADSDHSPLILNAKCRLKAEKPKVIATTASLFILINSISGILGQFTKENTFYELTNYWTLFLSVLIGGFIGNYLNLKILSNRTLTIMTSLLVIFVSIRIGIKLFL